MATSSATPSVSSYSNVSKILHWLTAILVVAAYFYGLGGNESRVYLPARDATRQLHETLGLAVFGLLVLRLLWRAFDRRPELQEANLMMALAAKAVHLLLYFLLISVPLTAVFGAWLEGHPITLLSGLVFESPMQASHDIGVILSDIHVWLANAILWVAGLHALAALYHHYVLNDDVLKSMLPDWFKKR